MKVMFCAVKWCEFLSFVLEYFIMVNILQRVKDSVQVPKGAFVYIASVYIVAVLVENVSKGFVSSYINFRLFALIIVVFGLFHMVDRFAGDS